LQNFVINNVLLGKKRVKTQQQQNKKSNIKTLAVARELNPGPLAPKADA